MYEHSHVTVDSDRPLPKELTTHPRSWALIGAAGVAALMGLLTLILT